MKKERISHDTEDRLTQVSGTATASFGYDGDGKRVVGVENGATIVYIGDYYEWHGTVTDTIKYFYAGSVRVAMKTGDALPKWLLGDHLGSTSVVANYDGSLDARQGYMAWGEQRFPTGASPLPTTFRYTGQREAAGVGLYFYGARWYDAALGRFVQADSIISNEFNPQDFDRFAYVLNNSINFIDPSGYKYCSGRDAGISGGCTPENDPFTEKELKDALEYEYRFDAEAKEYLGEQLTVSDLKSLYDMFSDFWKWWGERQKDNAYVNSPENQNCGGWSGGCNALIIELLTNSSLFPRPEPGNIPPNLDIFESISYQLPQPYQQYLYVGSKTISTVLDILIWLIKTPTIHSPP